MSDRSRVLVALRVPASAERAFAVFTEQIGQWWRPNTLFQFTAGRTGRLSFEPAAATGPATLGAANGAPGPRRIGPGARLVETYADGSSFVIGHVRAWEPPSRLVLSWRQAGFAADEETELHVRFDEVRDDAGAVRTRVTVEHFGWDGFPPEHVARHGFPLPPFQLRFAEWWRDLLGRLADACARAPGG